jgi:hypothetical protein
MMTQAVEGQCDAVEVVACRPRTPDLMHTTEDADTRQVHQPQVAVDAGGSQRITPGTGHLTMTGYPPEVLQTPAPKGSA